MHGEYVKGVSGQNQELLHFRSSHVYKNSYEEIWIPFVTEAGELYWFVLS